MRVLASKQSPKVMCMSESRTVISINDTEIKLDGYRLFRCDAANRHTGGVVIYCHESINAVEIFKYDSDYIWALAIKICNRANQYIICCIYRGHKASSTDFIAFTESLCEEFANYPCNKYIVGDINYDILNLSETARKVMSIFNRYNLKQIISTPTREDKMSATLIDWLITNDDYVEHVVISDDIIADHNYIALNFSKIIKKSSYNGNLINWKTLTNEKINEIVRNIDYGKFYSASDIDTKANLLLEFSENCVSNIVKFHKTSKFKKVPWFNVYLSSLKNSKISHFKKWKSDKSSENWISYKKIRNKYKNELSNSENVYIQSNLTKLKRNPNKLWKLLRSLYSDSKVSRLNSINFNGEIVSDKNTISKKLNDYFIDSVIQIAHSVPSASSNIQVNYKFPSDKFVFNNVTCDEIRIIIKSLPNKPSNDFLNIKSFSKLCECFSFIECYTDLVNFSLSNSCLPKCCKISTVTPVQKVKNSLNHSDLRPINQLPIYEKIIEKIVRNQIYKYLENNKFFMKYQSGFREHHSCESAINSVVHEWKLSLDSNKKIIAVFLDLKRAFETIDRRLMIKKLKECNLSDEVIEWFVSYLTHRFQKTKIDEFTSFPKECDIGIPQGSVLSCLLFIIFINDIQYALTNAKIHMFADDGMIFLECDNVSEGCEKMNGELTKVNQYLCHSRLALNIEKTKFMIVSNTRANYHIDIKIGNSSIEQVKEFKYLGVILDNSLSFEKHVDTLCKKLNQKFYVLKRIDSKLNCYSKITYYNSVVLPNIDYCSSILLTLNESQIKQIQLIQNRFMRLILRMDKLTSINSMLNMLQWQSIKQRIYANTMKFIHRVRIKESPIYLAELMINRATVHTHYTRNRNNLTLGKHKKTSTQNSLLYKGLQMYNTAMNDYNKIKREDNRYNKNFLSFINEYIRQNY